MRDSFVFYRSFYEAIRDLPRDVQGEIYTAIMEYGLYCKETEQLKPIARSMFTLMKPLLDANIARHENAKKGGAPKGLCNNPNGRRGKGGKSNQEQTENKPIINQEQTENKPNVNVDVNSKERESSKDNSLKKDSDSEFERFWDLYDKKTGDKTKIRNKFLKLSKTDRAKIFETLPAYVASTPEKRFRKNPETYLNNKSWNDEIINDNGARQTQSQGNWQANDLSKFRDNSRHYSSESDI
jgi:hypothetical protein